MSIDNSVNGFLIGSSAPSAKFAVIGTTIKGTIQAAIVSEQTDIGGAIRTWEDGSPRKQVVITLGTDDRDPEVRDDDGTRKLYVKGQMIKAVRDALKQANAQSIEVGGRLAVRYDRDGDASKPGFNPPKEYVAQYEAPPRSAVTVGDLL